MTDYPYESTDVVSRDYSDSSASSALVDEAYRSPQKTEGKKTSNYSEEEIKRTEELLPAVEIVEYKSEPKIVAGGDGRSNGEGGEKPADYKPAGATEESKDAGSKDGGSKNGKTTENSGEGTAAKPADVQNKGDAPSKNDAPKKDDKPVDSKKVEEGAEAIHKAMHGMWRSDSDYEKVNNILQGMTEKEREALKKEYERKHNIKLEDEFKDRKDDAQQDKAYNLLNKKDGIADDTGRIHTALVERDQLIEGRSDANCEKDIRDTLATMNSEQIAQLEKDYQKRYGISLRDALMNDENLSQKTKDALEIYLKGTDKRTDADTQKLADMALQNKDLEMFKESMRYATPEARKAFMDGGGEQKMKDAFEGHWYNAVPWVVGGLAGGLLSDGNVTDQQLNQAKDYAANGKLSTAEKIRENTGVVSNTDKAIEQAINDMSPEERAAFIRGKELAKSNHDESKLSEADKKALATYKEIHKAIEDTNPLDSAKKAKWEDMIEHKGGSLVGRIESHHGVIYNDSKGDVTKEIENMTKEDWEYAKKHPEYREQVLKALKDLEGSRIDQADIDNIMKLYDQKMAAKSFEESKNIGTRPLLEKLEDDAHWYKNDRKTMVESITHMTKEEQEKYRNDPEYRRKLDELIKDKIGAGNPAYEAARHLLDKVAQGQKPEPDLIVKMNMRAQENKESKDMTTAAVVGVSSILLPGFGAVIAGAAIADRAANDGGAVQGIKDDMVGSHSVNALRDMQEEFKKDPNLRERILHPKTEEDKKLAKEFETAARAAMGDADYEKYAKTLLEKGRLPIEEQMQLNKGAISNDKEGSYKDILNATPEEKKKILTDKDYQEKVLGYLSDDDRKVALNVLEQGKELPEDKIRAKLNHWGGSEDIMQTLREMKGNPLAIEKMKEEYARKYGGDLTADLIDKLSGSEKIEAEAILRRQPTSAREAYNDARDQHYQSYDGVGKTFVNKTWDGTGYMSEDALNQFSAKMTEFSAKFKELPLEQQKELTEKLHKSLDLFIESKGAAADAVVDAVIAIAAVAGAVFTEGVSLSLLLATGAGGAALKVLVNSVIMGSDYDWSAKNVSKDAVVGFINGFVSMIGPGELGALVKVGETAALKATQQALKEGAEQLIKKGGQAILEKEVANAVKNAIVSGSYEVSDKALMKIVQQVAKEGATDAEKEALKQSLKKALGDSLQKETKSMLQKLATEYAFTMGGGALGGASANAVGATMEWDNSKSISENMANIGKAASMGAVFGAAGAAAFTTVFKVGGSMYHGLVEAYKLKPGEQLNAEQLAKLAKDTGIKDAKFHYDEHGNLVLEGHPDRPAILPPEKQPGPHDNPNPNENPNKKPDVDQHGDTIPPTERPNTTEKVPQEELVKKTPEIEHLSAAEKAALLERAAKDPLFKPELVNDFTSNVQKLTSSPEWKGMNSEQRLAKLQKAMDEFADKHGLPHSKLELNNQPGEGVSGYYGDGKIGIRPVDLENPAKLMENLYHETVHARQDSLVIRNLADELKVPKDATPDQVQKLKDLYKERTGGELSDDHLKDILKGRDGKPLSAEDAALAKQAAEAFKNDPFRNGKLEELSNQQKLVSKELQPLFKKSENPNASKELIAKLADDPAYAKKLFGGDPPTEVQKLIDIHRRIQKGENVPFPKEQADNVLTNELQKRNSQLTDDIMKGLQDYQNNANEHEAYLIGRKARLEGEANGAGETLTDTDTIPDTERPAG